jgi:hypothetical protein
MMSSNLPKSAEWLYKALKPVFEQICMPEILPEGEGDRQRWWWGG